MSRLGVVGLLGALSLLVGAVPASASVTVGELPPGIVTSCSSSFDFLQDSTTGNSYAMPAAGEITSWTHRSQAGMGQTPTLKVFRKIGEPARYQVVGHDGPQPIGVSTTRTFPASIPVKAGDVLGLSGAGGASIACYVQGGTGVLGFRMSNLPDGGFGDFTLDGPNQRLNLSAVLNPTNAFSLGSTTRNKKKGTATITVNVPNPGGLTASGKGVKAAGTAVISKAVSGPGPVKLTIRAKGKQKRALNDTGKVKLRIAIQYTPTGGDPSSQSVKVKLKKS